jgi:hypothetical protein
MFHLHTTTYLVAWFKNLGIRQQTSRKTFNLHSQDRVLVVFRAIHDILNLTVPSVGRVIPFPDLKISSAVTYGIQLIL